MDGFASRTQSAEPSRAALDRAWLDAAPVLIWVSDLTKACVWFNKVWLDFTGRTPAQEQGDGWADGVHPDDYARCLATYSDAFDRREPFRMEYRLRRADGVYRWLDDVGAPYFGEDGAFLGYVGSCTDITDRRQVELDLLAAQNRLQLAQAAGGVGVWEYDIGRSSLIWSDEQKRLFGLPVDASPPDFASFMAHVHPEDRERMREAAAASWRAGGYDIEFRGVRTDTPDGAHRTYIARGQVLRDEAGQPLRMIGVNLDVTALRSAERALQAGESRFRGVFESSIAGLAVIERGVGRSQAVNNRLLELTGHARADFEAGPAPWLTLAGGRWSGADKAAFAQVMERGWFDPYERSVVRADGERLTVRLSSAPLPAEPDLLVMAVEDVTESRRAEVHRSILADLGELLQSPMHDEALFHAVAVLLGSRLEAAHCTFYRLDLEAGLMHLYPGWYAPGVVALPGPLPLGEYDPVLQTLEQGRTAVVDDCHTDPQIDDNYRPIFDQVGIRAFITVPLKREGDMGSCMSILSSQPRAWKPDEIELVRAVAERTWLAVENGRLSAERDRTLAALRESEARFRVLAESTPQLVWSTRPDGWCDYLSPQWVEYTGVPEAEQHGLGWHAAVHPDDRARASQVWADAVAGVAPYDVEYRLKGADGAWRWFQARGRPMRDEAGAITRWFGVSTDITDVMQAREALALQVAERTRERNRVFDLSRELIAVLDLNGRTRVVNPAWTETLGLSEAEILAHPLGRLIHPDDRPEAARHLEALRGGSPVPRYENRVRTGAGHWLWMAWTAVSDGESIYIVGRDITAEREAADALREANARLEAEMAERARMQEQLVQAQKMEAIGQLTGGVAHDFNNLLQVIVGALGLIDGAEPARRQRLTDAMRQAAARGEGLTRQLLAFSRRSALKPEVFDLAARVEALRELLERSLRGDMVVEMRFAPDLSLVEADPGEFELALLNIAVNARDAMPDGGRIVIAGEEVERFDDGPLSGRYVRLSVTDQGRGMPPDVLARVFEPFFTTKEVGKGSGLGLSQVYGFAEQSGGGVRIASEPGAGSTVSLYLPCATGSISVARAPAPAFARGASGGRVLLVEDDDAVAELACEMLEALGFDCVRASSALSALNLIRAEPIDVVLSDIMMPGGVSGLDLARRARALRPNLPVVLATGYSSAAAEARREGLTVLSKPYRMETLQAALAPYSGPARSPEPKEPVA
jgi:PAS domain S-box-containing protein